MLERSCAPLLSPYPSRQKPVIYATMMLNFRGFNFMVISQSDIEKVARLARLHLEAQEVSKAQSELMGIFNWIDQLQAIEVSGIELHNAQDIIMHERPDVVEPDTTVKAVLANAPQAQHDMFTVPKVVE